MKPTLLILATASLAVLSACGGNGDDRLAERVEDAADNRADALEARADTLENRADMLEARAEDIRDLGERRSDAIDAADLNTAAMTNAQKDAIVANEAAAVR